MLELISLKKEYVTKAGNAIAVNDVSLRFPETGLIFITGKSGSGKTTLLNIIGGLDGFDSGEIKLNGKSFSNFSDTDFDSYRNTFVGFIFQEYNLLPEYNVGKNIEIALELQGEKPDPQRVKELLERVEISGLENRKVTQLSGGQKQRVAIVRALIKNPKIILADELTGALDSVTGAQVMDILKKLSKEKLVIVVSHDLDLAEKYADRIINVSDGRVVQDVTLTERELTGNLFQTENQLTVKSPSELSSNENKILLNAIKQNKKICFTDKISVKERVDTVQPQINEEKEIKLINSKMKVSSAVTLGLKSVWTKPVRLIITILLSVLAFAVFGLFDAIASYTDGKVVTSLLRDDTYSALPVYATYTDTYYNDTRLKISQQQINELNDDTGYKFRGVYDIVDTDLVRYKSSREGYNTSISIQGLPRTEGDSYYKQTVNGFITFSQSEIVDKVIDSEGFNFKILYGEYPLYLEGAENFEIGISLYTAQSILYWTSHNENKYFGDNLFEVEDLIGKKLKLEDVEYTIKSIIDCGQIPEKYDTLKIRDNETLCEDFDTYLYSGCFLNVFAPEGLVEHIRRINNRAVNYYSDYKNSTHKVFINEYENEFSGRYYNISDIDETKYMFFESDKKSLQANETLISIRDIAKEYIKAEQLSKIADAEVFNRLNLRLSVSNDRTEIRKLLDELLAYIKSIQASDLNLEQTTSKLITVKALNRKDLAVKNESKLKVVGIYFGLDTDINTTNFFNFKFEPIIVSQEGLSMLGVTPNQGIYSRAITPLESNHSGERIMGSKMDTNEGLKYNWFGNSVLASVAAEREFVDQILNLILYVAIVLASFSIFMLFNYISLSIISKRQTIGILRTLGANKKNIFVMFIAEALIISLVNACVASVFACIGCKLINSYFINVMNLTLNLAMFDIRQILIITIGSVVTGIISSLAPILKITKKKPVELIRTI